MDNLISGVIYGIITGSIIALGAMGLSLIFRVARFINFAYGDTMTVGAYLALFFNVVFHLNIFISTIIAMALTALLGVILNRIVFRPIAQFGLLTSFISSMGVAIVLRNIMLALADPTPKTFNIPIRRAYHVGPAFITPTQIVIIVFSVIAMIGIHLFLQKTRLGKSMRAVADNPILARASGIKMESVISWAWVISCALAALGGVMYGSITYVDHHIGFSILLPIFAAVIMGGIGSLYGAMLGAMTIGLAMEISAMYGLERYKPAVAFIIMGIILLVRPRGIMGGK